MAEHFKAAGAFTASTARYFDARNGQHVGGATHIEIRKLKITNPTSARLTLTAMGRVVPVNPNGYAEQDFPGRLEEFDLVSDTTITDKVTLGFEGPVLPVWGLKQ